MKNIINQSIKKYISISFIVCLFAMGMVGNAFAQEQNQFEADPTHPSVLVNATSLGEINVLLTEAYTHMGTRYRSGGKNPNGFDCSGFVGYCYNKTLGIKTPASSSGFHEAGIHVPKSSARPGDVICFTGSNASRRISGHVGIITEVTDSNVYFIHAAVSGGIRVDALNQPYYKARFLEIRRFFQ